LQFTLQVNNRLAPNFTTRKKSNRIVATTPWLAKLVFYGLFIRQIIKKVDRKYLTFTIKRLEVCVKFKKNIIHNIIVGSFNKLTTNLDSIF